MDLLSHVQSLVNAVGLQVALGELKMELFKDGMSIAVLSAPPGCRKTTSAKLLCHVSCECFPCYVIISTSS
jgi:hypothetical protein